MATDAQDQLPIFDFPVISEAEEGSRSGGPGDETVWKADPPPKWNKGDKLGEVKIKEEPSGSGDKKFQADFKFDNPKYKAVKVRGDVPPGWEGTGEATAESEGRDPKIVPIEFKNPKRWG